jgi:O-antigen ligase
MFNQENSINSDSRFGIWIRALDVIKLYPGLGIGLDHSILYLNKYAHNTFLEWILSCGVFLGSIINVFYFINLLKHLRRAKHSEFDFYMFIAYLNHIVTLSFVSLVSFEPTFILFAISSAHFKNMKHKSM